ncbi:MAG: amidohydrolase family protein [Nonomuraea sp.]|nr:amidohydrolase family protein [Nonomuraea sp.]
MTTVIKNGIVIDTDPVGAQRADLLIEDGRIAAVGQDLHGDEVIDATDRIVLPGFVDSHRHTWQSVIRAVVPDADFAGYFTKVLGELAPRFTPEDVRIGNLMGALESLDSGTTTFLDWSHVQFTPGHTDAAVAGLEESGARAIFGFCGPAGDLEAETRRVAKSGVPLIMAASGPEFGDEDLALREWRLADELGLHISVHLGGHGPEAAERGLAWMRVNGFPLTAIHANHYTDEALSELAAHGVCASVSPVDEMTLGIGYPITGRAQAAGMPVSLSTDTVVCSPGDMFSLMRAAFTLECGRLSVADVLRMATLEGARAVGLADEVGSLRPGKRADLVLLRTDTPVMAGTQDPVGAVVLNADTAAVDTVLVGGRVVKRDGRLVGHDLPALVESLRAAGKRVVGPA